MAATSMADRLRAEIDEDGPLAVSRFVAAALYDEHDGFYTTTGRAGRRGDFLTAPEVGPLFGAVVSAAVDRWWKAAGQPSPFTVAEYAAGPGTLARTVTLAGGACLRAGALQWIMVEPSAAQRARHPEGDHLRSVATDAEVGPVDVGLANELLDNLPFDVVARRSDGWVERRVAATVDGFALVDGDPAPAPIAGDDAGTGAVLPVPVGAVAWIRRRRTEHPSARLVALDYAAPTAVLLGRDGGWLRAYRDHTRIEAWLAEPGRNDITIDVPVEAVTALAPDRVEPQAAWLRRHGIDELVEEGRRLWAENAAVGDLAALRARSRIGEADALLDPAGMGGFTVFEWEPTNRD